MTFMESQYQKVADKKAKCNFVKRKWQEMIINSCESKRYRNMQFHRMVSLLFFNLYEDTIKNSSKRSVLEYMYSKRKRMDEIAKQFSNPYEAQKFIIFCFWRLHHPVRKIFESMVWTYYHSLEDYQNSICSYLFDLHQVMRFVFSKPNGRKLAELIGYRSLQPGRSIKQEDPAFQRLKSL